MYSSYSVIGISLDQVMRVGGFFFGVSISDTTLDCNKVGFCWGFFLRDAMPVNNIIEQPSNPCEKTPTFPFK